MVYGSHQQLIETSGLYNLTIQNIIMLIIACVFLYLGIKRGYEPYLMVPIAFGMLLVNFTISRVDGCSYWKMDLVDSCITYIKEQTLGFIHRWFSFA